MLDAGNGQKATWGAAEQLLARRRAGLLRRARRAESRVRCGAVPAARAATRSACALRRPCCREPTYLAPPPRTPLPGSPFPRHSIPKPQPSKMRARRLASYTANERYVLYLKMIRVIVDDYL
ncbi:unnamed protein product, partial [Iphiclides podalirius]